MSEKVSPAVSQLAGEIAAKIVWTCCIAESDLTTLRQVLSAALSEREEKVANVQSAAKNLLAVLPKSAALVERVGGFVKELESALSALGE